MKREIKFKAKSANTGEWVYGYLATPNTIYDNNKLCIIDQNTICEFTGLKTPIEKKGFNKDGNYAEYQEIYEHDILMYNKENNIILSGGYCCPVRTEPGDKFLVRWAESGFVLIPLSKFDDKKIDYFNENGIAPNTGYIISSYDTWNYSSYFTVIGNEFD